MPLRHVALLLLIAGTPGCGHSRERPTEVPQGTWGGEDAALIVGQDSAHAHIGCTKGDVKGVIPLDADGRFAVDGSYNVNAFPVDLGILHPARFTGTTDGRTLTFIVRLTDTGQTLGPAVVTLGQEPRMGTCPICRRP